MHDVAPVKLRLLLQTMISVPVAEDGTLLTTLWRTASLCCPLLLILYDYLILPLKVVWNVVFVDTLGFNLAIV